MAIHLSGLSLTYVLVGFARHGDTLPRKTEGEGLLHHAEDLTGINAALARYVDGVNQRDEALWASSWDEEAQWRLFDPSPICGRDAIVAAWLEAMKGFPFVIMHATQGHVAVDKDEAQGRSYTSEIAETADGRHLRVWGCYEDRYRRCHGIWRFSSRIFSIMKSEDYQP